MTGVATAIGVSAVIGGGAAVYSANKSASAMKGMGDYPAFIENEKFNESQERLSGLGENLLEGDVPDFYRDIGKQGGPTFEKFLNMTNADISKSILESSAATGRSGGAVQSMTAEAVGKSSTKLRYQDYLNSVEGKKWLMNMGVDTLTGVRSEASNREARLNRSSVGGYESGVSNAQYQDNLDIATGKAEGEGWGEILNSLPQFASALGTSGFSSGNIQGTGIGGSKLGGITQSEVLGFNTAQYR